MSQWTITGVMLSLGNRSSRLVRIPSESRKSRSERFELLTPLTGAVGTPGTTTRALLAPALLEIADAGAKARPPLSSERFD